MSTAPVSAAPQHPVAAAAPAAPSPHSPQSPQSGGDDDTRVVPIPPPGPPVDPGGVLASDAERERTVRMLEAAHGEGRLGLDEAGERITAAYATRHRAALAPLVADLPGGAARRSGTTGGPFPDGPGWASVWESLVWRAHLVVRGPQAGPPTAAQCRTAVVVAASAVVWFLLCAVVGALVVGA